MPARNEHEPMGMCQVEAWSSGRRQYALFECPTCKVRKKYTFKRSRGGVVCIGVKQAAQPFTHQGVVES